MLRRRGLVVVVRWSSASFVVGLLSDRLESLPFVRVVTVVLLFLVVAEWFEVAMVVVGRRRSCRQLRCRIVVVGYRRRSRWLSYRCGWLVVRR